MTGAKLQKDKNGIELENPKLIFRPSEKIMLLTPAKHLCKPAVLSVPQASLIFLLSETYESPSALAGLLDSALTRKAAIDHCSTIGRLLFYAYSIPEFKEHIDLSAWVRFQGGDDHA